MLIVAAAPVLIITSSPDWGMVPTGRRDQLGELSQLPLPAIQVAVAGARRSSRASRHGRKFLKRGGVRPCFRLSEFLKGLASLPKNRANQGAAMRGSYMDREKTHAQLAREFSG